MTSFRNLSHLFLAVLLAQFLNQVNALDNEGSTIVIVVVVILIVFVGVLGVFIAIVLCKITNFFGIFSKERQQSRFSVVVPPPTLRPSSFMLPNTPEEAPPTYDDVEDRETTSNRESDHLPPPE